VIYGSLKFIGKLLTAHEYKLNGSWNSGTLPDHPQDLGE
jgi:hypothetical protein